MASLPHDRSLRSVVLGYAQIARQAADQQLADFARAPVRLAAFEADDEALDLRQQLVGVADRPARPPGLSAESCK